MEADQEKTLKAIGRNVKRIREAAGMTQSELARIADIHRNQVRRIEQGAPPANIKLFIAIAQAFEITLSKLLEIPEE